MKYKRVLLKLSGEVLGGNQGYGIEDHSLDYLTKEIVSIAEKNVQIGIVIGGGNIFRGGQIVENGLIDRVRGDYMGMLATVINGIALQTSLEKKGFKAKLITAFLIEKIGERYNHDHVLKYLSEGYILIFTAGTSNPYFTTDSGAALRAVEIGADVLLKATKVDGIYSEDPVKNKEAIKYDKISFSEAIEKNLKVLDLTAFALCKENNMPIIVFNSHNAGNLLRVVEKGDIGTFVS